MAFPTAARQPLAGVQSGRLVVAHGQRGFPGPVGPPGPAGGAAFQRLAGESLSALRYCYEVGGQVFPLDNQDATHIDLAAGLALSASAIGDLVNLQMSGPVDDSHWAWTPGPLWLGAAGALTQQPPTQGFLLQVGSALSPTRILLNPGQPIELA
ncbi:hypothetical protein SB18R_03225 [Pseudomonas oryzihabitans]|nr:hypothetical protein SB9_12460 [Pseudomonas psychrotolerans]KTT78293.1 hypothetical protein SB18R_03225 [Pseudomonas psychrotolerans]